MADPVVPGPDAEAAPTLPPSASPIGALLAGGSIILLDGGLATELERRGNDLSDPLWSARLLLEAPEEIVEAHLAYFRTGARVATTASYQASFEGFAERGIGHAEAAGLMRRSVELADEARRRFLAECGASGHRPGPLLVAASVGPYGAFLADGSEYTGRYALDRAALRDWHRERLAVLAGARADLLAIETIPSVDEGRALVDLLGEEDGPPAWLSFTCADGTTTRHGEPVEAAFTLADDAPRIIAVGVNCTAPEHVRELVERARRVTAKPIVAYPNSGEVWDPVARRWLDHAGPTVDAVTARGWLAAGATLVGGCCRVGPDRIAELAAAGLG